MAFKNRIRLPFKLHKPQYVETVESYRKANGETVVLSVVIRKIYEGITDEWPEKLHERFKIALRHDSVQIEGDKYVGMVAQDGDYQIDWSDFLSRPIAQGKFKAEVTPFNATNSNCGSCQEFTQVVANDDNLGTLNEGDHVISDPLSNDQICCNPVSISLVTVNSTYISNVVINTNNSIEFDVNNPVSPANGVVLLTYRAQCQNGQFDDANIIADITGSLPACLSPTNLSIIDVTATTADINWDDMPTASSYDWILYKLPDLVTQIASLNVLTSNASLSSLEPNTSYRLYVRTQCNGGSELSPFTFIDFITSAASNVFCGEYSIHNNSFILKAVTYTDCNGNTQNIVLVGNETRVICALQSSPGIPISITTSGATTITYLGLC